MSKVTYKYNLVFREKKGGEKGGNYIISLNYLNSLNYLIFVVYFHKKQRLLKLYIKKGT